MTVQHMANAAPAGGHVRRTEVLAEEPAESLAALLDIERPLPGRVPPLWHWLYLLPRPAQSALGPDGHPRTGVPAPPAPGQRRMFAGGRVRTLDLLRIGEPATRTTRVMRTAKKAGRSGPLTFVTVRTEIAQEGTTAVVEEQDIVYRAPAGGSTPPQPLRTVPAEGARDADDRPRLRLEVSEALLFRFSALTYNAHRIHYDRAWAAHEGYHDLVVHGPLQALAMGELMRRNGVDLVGSRFAYRLVRPMIGPQTLHAEAADDGLATGARVRTTAGEVTALAVLE